MTTDSTALTRNLRLYPWHEFLHNLVFWQATWFLYFQMELSAAEALLLYVAYDLSVTVLEVPSGYMSDRLGRRITLIGSAAAYVIGLILLGVGGGFAIFLVGQCLLGTSRAFLSGTNTALLYQSLAELGRAEEMEDHTLRAWRFGFSALGISAVTGGAMALWMPSLPFFAAALALVGAFVLAILFAEPHSHQEEPTTEWARLGKLIGNFRQPIVLWLFVLGMLMYGYSHIPFVFGQPFIAETLGVRGYEAEAPLVSGVITALMMALSVLVSLFAKRLRVWIGLFPLLLIAFAMQIGLAGALAAFGSVFAIALLLLRMVPDSLSTPFITAALQPLIGDATRATFLSLKSFIGRLLFAGSLALAAGSTTTVGEMPLGDIQSILLWYFLGGLAVLTGLAVAALRLRA